MYKQTLLGLFWLNFSILVYVLSCLILDSSVILSAFPMKWRVQLWELNLTSVQWKCIVYKIKKSWEKNKATKFISLVTRTVHKYEEIHLYFKLDISVQ